MFLLSAPGVEVALDSTLSRVMVAPSCNDRSVQESPDAVVWVMGLS